MSCGDQAGGVGTRARLHVDGNPLGTTLVPHGVSVVLNNPSVRRYTAHAHPTRHLDCARFLDADMRGTTDHDAGEVFAGRVIGVMKATEMPNGLTALGFGEDQIDALATRAEPQYRVIKNASIDVGRDDISRCSVQRYATGTKGNL